MKKIRGLALAFTAITIMLVVVRVSVDAENVNTSVTVGNSAPSYTVDPAESPASTTASPTNVGSNVTFNATATDSNNEDYYLAICKTNSVTAVNGGAPTCAGGNWCITTATDSGVQASCSYTTLIGDATSNAWYAFVCDGNASAASCSTADQGTGDSGSPFETNHRPVYTTTNTTVTSAANPGGTITINIPSGDVTDSDSDTAKVVVCKTSGTSAGDCDGGASDRWCQSSLTALPAALSCQINIDNPTVDGDYDVFIYVFDAHNFEATGNLQDTYTVNNVAPVVSAVTLNGGSDITLTESTTTNVTVTATVTDNNSCSDISTVTTSVYRSGVGYTGCDTGGEANANNCYSVVSCTVVGGSCTGTTDGSANYTCTVSLQYHADPTDTATTFSAQNWLNTVLATDDDAATGNTELGAGIEVLSLVAFDIDTSIAYGSLSPGQSNDPLDKVTTVTATGNVGVDIELSGTDLASGGDTITVGNQKYSYPTGAAYAAGTALTVSAVEEELNVNKTTVTGTPADEDVVWGILIPNGTPTGTYTGTNTATVVKSEFGEW